MTDVSSRNLALNAAIYVNQANCSVGDKGATRIGHRAVDGAGFRLRAGGQDHAHGKEEENWENGEARAGTSDHDAPPNTTFWEQPL
jgi:hypothetical protein